MSILIRGMEMPVSCAECDAEEHYEDSYGDEYGFFCPFGYKAYTSETRDAKRLDNCPLVEIPPHGRVIDVDKVLDELAHNLGIRSLDYLTPSERAIVSWFRDAPTIIPAEEGET